MRSFIAIEFDDETRKFLLNIQDKFRKAGINGNYSRPENLHLTIRFLGEVDDDLLKSIKTAIKNVASRHSVFSLSIDSAGKFDKGSKSIVWAGLTGSRELFDLYSDMDKELRIIMSGLTKEKYSPHITLIREAHPREDIIKAIQDLEKTGHKFTVSGISLMESTRIDGRLTYIRRDFAPMKPNE